MKKVIFSILVGTLMCILAGCGTTTIDLNRYVTIEADGYNNAGTAEYTFAWDDFAEDYYDKISVKKESTEIEFLLTFGAEPIDIFKDMCINYQLENDKNLSNGDIVTFTWDCDEEAAEEYFGCKIKCSDIEYEVEGLEDVPTFDPFEYISVKFTNESPRARAEYELDYTRPEMQYINVELSATEGLELGEEVIATVSINRSLGAEGFVEKYGVIPGVTEKTYIVEGVPAYVLNVADITEDELKSLATVDDELRGRITTNWDDPTSLSNVEYVGYYFMSPKAGGGLFQTKLYIVYKATAINPNLQAPFDYYVYDLYEDIMRIDGNLQYGEPTYPALITGFLGILLTDEVFENGGYTYAGFETIDAFYQKKIVGDLNSLEFSTNIK